MLERARCREAPGGAQMNDRIRIPAHRGFMRSRSRARGGEGREA